MSTDPTPIPADEMYKKRYFEIAELLDEVLGTDEEVRTGEGIVQDVHLLVQLQREASRRADATRQMANEANAALRSLLLAALSIEDDGKTSLTDYVNALIADRDAAHDRGRTAAAADIRATFEARHHPMSIDRLVGERAARVAENGADHSTPVQRTTDVALDCGGCGDTIWPTEHVYELGEGRVRCVICQVKSSGRGADQ